MNYVLVFGPPHSGKVRLALLLGVPTTPISDSHSGLIFRHDIANRHYTLYVSLLVDECARVASESGAESYGESFQKWMAEFALEAYSELREAIDGVIFTIPRNDEVYFEACDKIRDALGDNIFYLVVSPLLSEEIEDLALSRGFECVDLSAQGVNEYKEKQGIERVKEVLESHEWLHMEKADGYLDRKQEKMEEMKESLLANFDSLVSRIKQEKEVVNSLPEAEKAAHAKAVVEDLMNFI